MTSWTPLSLGYLALAIIGLIATWAFNIQAIATSSEWFGEWFSNGPATQSLQVDLLVVAVAASVVMVVEGRRVGIRWAWLLVVLSGFTAIAFTFPLFLALRERRLAQDRHPRPAS